MTLKQPSPADFEPAELAGYGVSVLFKPTQARYMFKVINGILQPGRTVDRRNADLGGYDGSHVERYARQVAATFAASFLRHA
jgi:hypothetical protein